MLPLAPLPPGMPFDLCQIRELLLRTLNERQNEREFKELQIQMNIPILEGKKLTIILSACI